MKAPAFGLDISDLSLKIAQLKKEKQALNLSVFDYQSIAPGIINQGRIKKSDELTEIIKKVTAKHQKILQTNEVICSLPEEEAFIKIIKLPKMKKEEIPEAIKWEIEANVPYSIEEVYYDWQIISPLSSLKNPSRVLNKTKEESFLYVVIAVQPKSIVNDYLKVLKNSNLQPIVLEIESQSLARSLIKNEISPKPVVILDLGITGTGLTIFSNEAVCFTSHIPISGEHFNQAIQKKMKITKEEAIKLKIKVGLDKSKMKGKVFEALEPIINDFSNKIQYYINFWKSHSLPFSTPNGQIEKIILCGGDANLIGLPLYLSKKLKIPVQLGNPWVNILKFPIKKTPKLSYKKSLAYATTLGLALRGLEMQNKWI